MPSRFVPAVLIVLVLALSVYPAITVSSSVSIIATDSDTPNTSLGIIGAQKLIEDNRGKHLAIYVDSPGDRLAVAVSPDPRATGTWTRFKSPAPTFGYKHPAGVLVSDDMLRIIAEGGTGRGHLVDVLITLTRDAGGNIVGVSFGQPQILDNSGNARNPNAILAHDGSIILVWNQVVAGQFSRVLSLRWTEQHGWASLAGTGSSTADTPIVDSTDFGVVFAGLIEREDNNNVILVGNRFNTTLGTNTNLVFNMATYSGAAWTWGTQSLSYETNAARGQEDAPSLAYDRVQNLLVVAYDFAQAHKYGVFTLDASNNRVHLDTPLLNVRDSDWGTVSVDASTGEYYLFLVDADFDAGGGPMGYTRFVSGLWNPSLTIIDSSDNVGISVKKFIRPGLEVLFMTGRGNPSIVKFASLSLSSAVSLIEISTDPSPYFVGQPVTISGTLVDVFLGSGIPGKNVEVQQSYDGASWTILGATTTIAGGFFDFSITFFSSNTYYLRTVFFTDSNYLGSTSNVMNHRVLPPDSSSSFSFAVGGDLGATVATTASLDALATSGSSFFLAIGDLSYGMITPESAWCDYVKSHVGASFPFELLSGNHESGSEEADGGLIENFLTCLPDRIGSLTGTYGKEYYFDYPAASPLARIILISPALNFTNGGYYQYKVGNSHYAWLSTAIDSARAVGIPWVIVAMHKNCLTIGTFTCSVGTELLNLLINKKVDLVLHGHDHTYQRSKQLACATPENYVSSCVLDDGSDGGYLKGAGTVFVVSGMFGSTLHPVNATDPDAGYFATAFGSNTQGNGHGFVMFTVRSDRIEEQLVLTRGGPFVDSFQINAISVSVTPSRPWFGTPAAFQATVTGGSAPYAVTWDLTGDGAVDVQGDIVSWNYDSPQIVTVTVSTSDVNGASTRLSFAVTVLPFSPSQFRFDWADYDNNGAVTILDIGTAALCWNKNSGSNDWSVCAYWDFNLNERIDIGDVATAALQHGKVIPGPYAGQGELPGLIDGEWLRFCSGLALSNRAYCETS